MLLEPVEQIHQSLHTEGTSHIWANGEIWGGKASRTKNMVPVSVRAEIFKSFNDINWELMCSISGESAH